MKRILVIEDDPVIRKLIVTVAQEAGFLAREAADGQHALEYLEEGRYDLVTLDLMLPRLSGYALLEYLSSKEKLPFVILVTAADDRDLEGIDSNLILDVVRKPFDIGYLRRSILEAFERDPATAVETRARLELGGSSAESRSGATIPPVSIEPSSERKKLDELTRDDPTPED